MEIGVLLMAALCSFIGSTVQTSTGFGYSIVTMATLPLMLGHIASVTVTNTINLLMTSVVSFQLRKHIRFKLLAVPLLFYCISCFFCIKVMSVQPDHLLKRVLGVFLILLGIYFLFFASKIKIKPNFFTAMVVGLLSGVLSAFFTVGGPPIILYLLNATDSREEYLGSVQFYFAAIALFSLIVRSAFGAFTLDILKLAGAAFVGMLLGVLAGSKILRFIKPQIFKKVVYIFIMLMGVWITITA